MRDQMGFADVGNFSDGQHVSLVLETSMRACVEAVPLGRLWLYVHLANSWGLGRANELDNSTNNRCRPHKVGGGARWSPDRSRAWRLSYGVRGEDISLEEASTITACFGLPVPAPGPLPFAAD